MSAKTGQFDMLSAPRQKAISYQVKVTGRKDVPGKPLLYSTTKYFLEYMGINDISELPTFREWQELKAK
jgi:chromosome segregation and condensation protein ScpB